MIFTILEIIITVLLIGAIIMQMQGSGMGGSFGAGGEMYRSKRSLEKFLVYATVVLASLFAIVSMILLFHK